MKRQKVQASSAPHYPTRSRFRGRRAGLACVGMMLVMIGSPGCPGDVAVPHESYFVALPREGSRTLTWDGGSYVDFHIEATVDNWDLHAFLVDNAPELLDRVEALLAEQLPTTFQDGEALREVERAVQQLLADQWTGSPESPLYNFLDCALIIDDAGVEDPIDGDMPA